MNKQELYLSSAPYIGLQKKVRSRSTKDKLGLYFTELMIAVSGFCESPYDSGAELAHLVDIDNVVAKLIEFEKELKGRYNRPMLKDINYVMDCFIYKLFEERGRVDEEEEEEEAEEHVYGFYGEDDGEQEYRSFIYHHPDQAEEGDEEYAEAVDWKKEGF